MECVVLGKSGLWRRVFLAACRSCEPCSRVISARSLLQDKRDPSSWEQGPGRRKSGEQKGNKKVTCSGHKLNLLVLKTVPRHLSLEACGGEKAAAGKLWGHLGSCFVPHEPVGKRQSRRR